MNGSLTVSPTETTTYTIIAVGAEGTASRQVTLTVSDVHEPLATIEASATEIFAVESVTLSWTSTYADSCEITPNIGVVSLNGSLPLNPAVTTTYILTVVGAGGTVTSSVTVTVIPQPEPTVTFTASPETITVGESSTLTWSTENTESVTIEPNIGAADLSGSYLITPEETTNYTITATGSGGVVTSSVTVTVIPNPAPVVTFTANPESIVAGESTTLTWSSENSQSVIIEPDIGAVELNGSEVVTPLETTTYTVTATGPGGTVTESLTVMVSAPTLPVVNISASPSTINYGESSILSWSCEYADTCTISPDLGTVSLQGTISVSPERSTVYTITATGIGGSATAQTEIIVASQVDPQPTGSFGSRYEDLIPTDATLQTYTPERFAVINGSVMDSTNFPLQGVLITILNHPEYGTAMTDEEGFFSLPVMGGGDLTVVYKHDGLITAHRRTYVPWNNFAVIEPVVLITKDSAFTTVLFDGDPSNIMSHRSTPVSDEFGSRSCTLVFTGDNMAYEVDKDGNRIREINTATVRATEFSTIESMPAVLPPTSAYTYCAELSFDEAERVEFDQPVVMWVDNFLGFDVGGIVPVGYYDRDRGVWIPSDNSIVVQLLDTDGDGVVDALDADGDSVADDLDGDGLTSDEVIGLSDFSTYAPGSTFWRAEVPHFSSWDCNCPYKFPSDSEFPNSDGAPRPDEEECPSGATQVNSYISDRSQVFHEDIPVPGTDFTLHYASNRVADYLSLIKVPVSGNTVPASLEKIEWDNL